MASLKKKRITYRRKGKTVSRMAMVADSPSAKPGKKLRNSAVKKGALYGALAGAAGGALLGGSIGSAAGVGIQYHTLKGAVRAADPYAFVGQSTRAHSVMGNVIRSNPGNAARAFGGAAARGGALGGTGGAIGGAVMGAAAGAAAGYIAHRVSSRNGEVAKSTSVHFLGHVGTAISNRATAVRSAFKARMRVG